MDYYQSIIELALGNGYVFCTVDEFIKGGCPDKGHFILRHDVDLKPLTLQQMIDIEIKCGVVSSIYARVAGSNYNVMDYPVFSMLKNAEEKGCEIGLHSNFLEYAMINNVEPLRVLNAEFNLLNCFFDIKGIACHRDINYVYNSLPYVEKNWKQISDMGLQYETYDSRILKSTTYVNEGLNPHLCWRNDSPENVIQTRGSIYLLTHNHWWYTNHPFEA